MRGKRVTILEDREFLYVLLEGITVSLISQTLAMSLAGGACQEAISVAWPGALGIVGLVCAVSRGLQIQ